MLTGGPLLLDHVASVDVYESVLLNALEIIVAKDKPVLLFAVDLQSGIRREQELFICFRPLERN